MVSFYFWWIEVPLLKIFIRLTLITKQL